MVVIHTYVIQKYVLKNNYLFLSSYLQVSADEKSWTIQKIYTLWFYFAQNISSPCFWVPEWSINLCPVTHRWLAVVSTCGPPLISVTVHCISPQPKKTWGFDLMSHTEVLFLCEFGFYFWCKIYGEPHCRPFLHEQWSLSASMETNEEISKSEPGLVGFGYACESVMRPTLCCIVHGLEFIVVCCWRGPVRGSWW